MALVTSDYPSSAYQYDVSCCTLGFLHLFFFSFTHFHWLPSYKYFFSNQRVCLCTGLFLVWIYTLVRPRVDMKASWRMHVLRPGKKPLSTEAFSVALLFELLPSFWRQEIPIGRRTDASVGRNWWCVCCRASTADSKMNPTCNRCSAFHKKRQVSYAEDHEGRWAVFKPHSKLGFFGFLFVHHFRKCWRKQGRLKHIG